MKNNRDECKQKMIGWIQNNIKEDENNERIQQFTQ